MTYLTHPPPTPRPPLLQQQPCHGGSRGRGGWGVHQVLKGKGVGGLLLATASGVHGERGRERGGGRADILLLLPLLSGTRLMRYQKLLMSSLTTHPVATLSTFSSRLPPTSTSLYAEGRPTRCFQVCYCTVGRENRVVFCCGFTGALCGPHGKPQRCIVSRLLLTQGQGGPLQHPTGCSPPPPAPSWPGGMT